MRLTGIFRARNHMSDGATLGIIAIACVVLLVIFLASVIAYRAGYRAAGIELRNEIHNQEIRLIQAEGQLHQRETELKGKTALLSIKLSRVITVEIRLECTVTRIVS